MAMSSFTIVALVALMALSAAATCPALMGPGLFTDTVDWGCSEPFDCLTDFCGCVDGQLSTACMPFSSSVSAHVIEQCTARRVTCTLNAALNARGSTNQSCREWGNALSQTYASFYADRSNTNLTDACVAEMCDVVATGETNATRAAQVNLTYVCSLVNFSFPAPLEEGEVPGCVATRTNRTYFDQLPVQSCPQTAACVHTVCTCLGGTFNTTTFDCKMQSANPTVAAAKQCVATGMSCIVSSALSVYVPAASPFDPNECVAWSVPIAQDYAAYYAASTTNLKHATTLYRSCNHSACNLILGNLGSADFATVCDVPATARPTFEPFDECPYECPDTTCAYDLAGCACTRNASVSGLQALFAREPSGTYDVSKPLSVAAYASYGIASGPCSSFDFTPALAFLWTLSYANHTVVAVSNSSTFVVPALVLRNGASYILNVSAIGLLHSQRQSLQWTFTAVLPPPQIAITGGGGALRVGSAANTTIKAVVVDLATTTATYAWSCVVVSGGACPSLTDSTVARVIIYSGAAAGTFTITYTYRSTYTQSVNLTIVEGSIPLVRVVASNTPLSASPLAFLSAQTIQFGSSVVYSSKNVSYSWTVNGGSSAGDSARLSVVASDLMTTTLAQVGTQAFVLNNIVLTVTSTDDTSIFGEASIQVIVVEALTPTLTVAKVGGGASAVALTDDLILTPGAGSLTPSNSPFGAPIAFAFDYFDNVSGKVRSVGLATTPSGAAFTAGAPLYGFAAASESIVFRAGLFVNGLRAGTVNASFTIARPSDLSGAAARQLSQLTSITDPAAAVAASGNLRALLAQSTNSTLVAQLAAALVKLLVDTVTDLSHLSASQQASTYAALASSMGVMSTADKKRNSEKVSAIISSALNSDTFDFGNTDSVADAINSMAAEAAALLSLTLGSRLTMNSDLALGAATELVRDSFTLTILRQVLASVTGSAIGGGSRGGVTMPSSLDELGLDDDAILGVSLATLADSPYDDAPSGSVVSCDFTSNGAVLSVSGLSYDIVVTLPDGSGSCFYYSTSAGKWKNDGLRTVINSVTGKTECHTRHLTSFGSFASSSATTVALSLLAVVVAAALQLILA